VDVALALATALRQNTTLEELDLWNNNITEKGGKALLEVVGVSNRSLKKLCVLDNNLEQGIHFFY
jgi:hypothetical protein